jgi:hypothetical protein
MFKKALFITITSAWIVGCATTPAAHGNTALASADSKAPSPCVRDSASRIPARPGECSTVLGRSYSQEEIYRTGHEDVGRALQDLDPAITVSH